MAPTAVLPDNDTAPPVAPGPVLDVVVPVYNEEADLGTCIRRLVAHLSNELPYTHRITIADNASTDSTPDVARALAAEFASVTSVRLERKGRGLALHHVWSRSDADVLVYMDVDLSTDLAALLPLVAPLISGHSDLSIGTRLAPGARVVRGTKREFISRSYNLILRGTLAARFSDAQCGFKAIRRDVAGELLPLVEDDGWFFDTELLVLAQRSGLRIHEVPVDWVDDPDSRVDVLATAIADLRGVMRLTRGLVRGSIPIAEVRRDLGRDALQPTPPASFAGQLLRFVAIGIASTLLYAMCFLVLRDPLGAGWANATALVLTAIANIASNRRFTFGVRGRDDLLRQQVQGMLVLGFGLALTTGALAALHAVTADPSRRTELLVLVLANLVTTAVRFVAFRSWVFADARIAPQGAPST